jgi:hypothetical protein
VGYKHISLFVFCKKNEWNGVWWNSFHPISLILSIFHST